MSEDIHKWSDGRYTLMFDEHTFFVFDNEKEERMTALETTKRLNEQQATIEEQNKLIEKLRWDLNKTREDLNYFANLKVMAMKGCEPMSEKRFVCIDVGYGDDWYITDNGKRLSDMEIVELLNEQQSNINKKKELLKLIANACSFNKEHSVKEILRNEIKGIDTVTYESANAWHDYVLLSEFFEECYGEHWDNE